VKVFATAVFATAVFETAGLSSEIRNVGIANCKTDKLPLVYT
jgi:hypothetical protein